MKRPWIKNFRELMQTGDESCQDLKKQNLPKSIFKYRNFKETYHLDNLRNGIEYLSPANKFNDPYDSRFYINPKDNKVLKLGIDCEKFKEKTQEMTRVCSFSAAPIETNLLMWGHYSHNHEGFCIKYDMSEELGENLQPVIYDNKQYDLTGALQKQPRPNLFGYLTVLIKYDKWEYEEEWRYIYPGEQKDECIKFEIPTPSVIYLGAKIEAKNKVKIAEIAIEKNIPVYQMIFKETDEYELEDKLIEFEELKKLVEMWENTHEHISSCGK